MTSASTDDAPTVWRNWSGLLSATPSRIAVPADSGELGDLVRSVDGPVRVAGSGHSFSPLVPTDGVIVRLDRMVGIIDHDPSAMTARIGAGTVLGELVPALDAIGQALPNMGDIDRQTLGGALGTATHGTGATLTAYHGALEAVELVDGTGVTRRIDSRSGMIEAIGVSLGAFGIITEATLRNVAPYRLHKRRRALPLAAMLADFERLMLTPRSAEFYVIPHSGTALLLTADVTEAQATNRPPDNDEDGLKTLARLRDWLAWSPRLRGLLIGAAISRIPPDDYVETWYKAYASDRRTRFNEMEYHLPLEEGPAALSEIVRITERDFPDVYFPMEVRTVAADSMWLSPFYRRPTCSIAIHHDAPRDPRPYQAACERIFRAHGGRPHWGKMHSLTAADLRPLYPRWDEAMEVRRSLDPDNRFLSPYLERLLGVE